MAQQIKALYSEADIAETVLRLANQINQHFAQSQKLIIIGLLKGAMMFMADLCRHLQGNIELDVMCVSSYGNCDVPSEKLNVLKGLQCSIAGADVLVLDDILDTGNTLSKVLAMLKQLGPNKVATCVLLDKPSRRKVTINADFVGFTVPDVFIVGYGIDYAEQYRHLPYIAHLE